MGDYRFLLLHIQPGVQLRGALCFPGPEADALRGAEQLNPDIKNLGQISYKACCIVQGIYLF